MPLSLRADRAHASAAIVTYTTSGSTTSARRASTGRADHRPAHQPGDRLPSCRRLGVHSIYTSDANDFEDMTNKAGQHAYYDGIAHPGERIIITAGVPSARRVPPT